MFNQDIPKRPMVFSFGQVNYCAIINIENNVQSSNFEIETLSCIFTSKIEVRFLKWEDIWIYLDIPDLEICHDVKFNFGGTALLPWQSCSSWTIQYYVSNLLNEKSCLGIDNSGC